MVNGNQMTDFFFIVCECDYVFKGVFILYR